MTRKGGGGGHSLAAENIFSIVSTVRGRSRVDVIVSRGCATMSHTDNFGKLLDRLQISKKVLFLDL